MSKTRRALLTLLVLAMLKMPLDMLLEAMLPDVSVNPVPGCIAGMALSLLTLGLPAWLQRPWTSPRLTAPKTLLPGLVLSVVTALLIRSAMIPVDTAWQAAMSLMPNALPAPDSIPLAMLYIAALVIVPALTEETFFRGALLTGLLDGSRRITAVLVTTLAFAFMHGSLANLPSLLVLSLLLTLLMLYSGKIAVPMAAHLIYNLTALDWPAVPLWGSSLSGTALIALAAFITVRLPKVAHQPMKWPEGLISAVAIAGLAIQYFI